MAGTNTEKPTGKAEHKKQIANAPRRQNEKVNLAPIKEKKKIEEVEKKSVEKEKVVKEKKEIKKIKLKKTKVSVKAKNLSISVKVAASICKYILNKKIEKAISDLEKVQRLKLAIPMKGEYAHRKGKIMSGKYPVRASKQFILLLQNLKANAIQGNLENPIIGKAIANKGTTVYASGGRRKKRTHLQIFCVEKKIKNKEKLKK